MNHVIYDKTYLFEMLVVKGSSAQQINFPIIELLNNKYTQALKTYLVQIIPKAPSNTPLANSNLLAVTYANLYVGDNNTYWNLPLLELVTLNAQPFTGIGSNSFAVEFDNERIIWSKSHLFIADITQISAAQDESFMFNIVYSDIYHVEKEYNQ